MCTNLTPITGNVIYCPKCKTLTLGDDDDGACSTCGDDTETYRKILNLRVEVDTQDKDNPIKKIIFI